MEDDDVEKDQETGADIPVIKFELEPEPSEAKVTNSPSSITTTTYSTQSTMGIVATDDEISEGEQLQVCVVIRAFEYFLPSDLTKIYRGGHFISFIPGNLTYELLSHVRVSCNKSAAGLLRLVDKPSSGCVRIGCPCLFRTSLLQIFNRLVVSCSARLFKKRLVCFNNFVSTTLFREHGECLTITCTSCPV